ncbi:MAG TPA: tetratricopeptide repeat protein [Planctomycetaceae bacterium]|nr:tetratricopeptide repeat protein [Planctomycetaceae bacterium]
MLTASQHESLISEGLCHHEAFEYKKALTLFRKAYKETPLCSVAQYNYANTLFMLERYDESSEILRSLLATPDAVLRVGCPLQENPRPFKLDANYLLFLNTLYKSGNWEEAYPFAENHLSLRSRGLKSIWSIAEIRKEILRLKDEFCEESN